MIESDSFEVDCPSCRGSIGNLWDYEWRSESVRTNCPHCGVPVILTQDIQIDYTIRLDEIQEGEDG